MQHAHVKGFPTIFQSGQWVFEDTGESIKKAPRNCRRCGSGPSEEGYDSCLGTLPGVSFACCGHGVSEQAYIKFNNGLVIRGFTVCP